VNGKEKREKWNDRPGQQATRSCFQEGVLRFRSGHDATIAYMEGEWPLISRFFRAATKDLAVFAEQ